MENEKPCAVRVAQLGVKGGKAKSGFIASLLPENAYSKKQRFALSGRAEGAFRFPDHSRAQKFIDERLARYDFIASSEIVEL